jgi:hypothetical protein
MPYVIVRIPREGLADGSKTVRVEADGFTGTGCEQAVDKYRQSLGEKVDQSFKEEYYAENELRAEQAES